MKFDDTVRYVKSHEWARKDGDEITVGISDYAQDSLGDVVFVELPEIGATFTRGTAFGVVESVKAASDIYAPLDGEVVAVNDALNDNPAAVNEDAFGDGWLIKLKASDLSQFDALMNVDDYKTYSDGLDE
ncbi:MAG: glycine cleavage system protein GcvH [Spirochaetaceae bacterium]|nr:MAG: glycine cleavage system protein GcvH [Spirochaetaceae bacterium]